MTMTKAYLVFGYVSWEKTFIENNIEKIPTAGAIGYCPVFETLEDAMNYDKEAPIAEIWYNKNVG